MNELRIFNHDEFGEIRTVEQDGVIWFVGKDVARALGYKDTINAIKNHVDEDDKMGWQIATTSRGTQKATIINESGLYSLVLSSKLPKAKSFKRWVTSEVLPSIRKTGKYEIIPQAVEVEEPITDVTKLEFDQRIRIAGIIASCRRERLPLVAKVLSINIESMKEMTQSQVQDKEAYEYISSVYDSLKRDTPIKMFYADYSRWCMENGTVPMSKQSLTKLFKHYFPISVVATSYYEGGQRIFGCVRCYRKMGGAAK